MQLERIDRLLVDRGLADSRTKAQALVMAGAVLVDEQLVRKSSEVFSPQAQIRIKEEATSRYVGRGGIKLEAALRHFEIDVSGFVCLDVGASTGGFTDCLLQHAARRVVAVDVGHGQIDWKLRNDPRVEVREGVNARHLEPRDFNQLFDLAVMDVSFISATVLLPPVTALLAKHAEMVILVKPQFEVGKGQVGKGGIVRDPALHSAACDRVRGSVESLGYTAQIMESPILGAEGNREFLLHARPKY